MNTLYQNLERIYESDSTLQILYPFNETYLLIRRFLIDCLSTDNEIIEAEDYSIKFAKDYYETLNLFLSLSKENGIFSKMYMITCSECGELTINYNLSSDYECYSCGEPLDLEENNNNSIFNNIGYAFEIKPIVIKEIKTNLKAQPSLLSNAGKEGTEEISATVYDVLNSPIIAVLPEIQNEKEHILNQFRSVMLKQ